MDAFTDEINMDFYIDGGCIREPKSATYEHEYIMDVDEHAI